MGEVDKPIILNPDNGRTGSRREPDTADQDCVGGVPGQRSMRLEVDGE
jgi:hypothetical protein